MLWTHILLAMAQVTAPTPGARTRLVQAHLEKILGSAAFCASPRLRQFLRFVVEETLEGRASEIKESVVACQVFGRRSDFDSRIDSVVRVHATHLRQRLRDYYLKQGQLDAIIIDLPPGAYVPVFRDALPAAGAAGRKRKWQRVAAWATVLIAIGAAGWWMRAHSTWLHPAAPRSIAILPFMNLTGGAGDDYIADGLVEDLTTALARRTDLRVAARTSAFQFRGHNQDIRKIGQQLGVSTVLEGSVRRQGVQLAVTAQLINSENGYHLWSNSYQSDVANVRDVEAEIEHAVAEALGGRRVARVTPAHVAPPEAREAYWRGRFVAKDWRRRRESIPYFERALAADPRFAEAYAAMAWMRAILAFHLEGPVVEQATKAKQAAQRALALDETIAEAYAALALLSYSFDHDWSGGERAWRRAIELNPSYAAAHRGLALELMALGRFNEAIEQVRLADELDPMLVLSGNDQATVLYCARRYEDSIRVARRHLKMDGTFYPPHVTIGTCEAARGRFAEAISELEKSAAAGGRESWILGPLGNALARAGRLSEARKILDEIQSLETTNGTDSVGLAMVQTGLGERKAAIESLRRAAAAHVTDVIFIGVDPVFDPLRAEPEFQALRAQLGLP